MFPMIEVYQLAKGYAGVTALRGISFKINEGEIVGYLGPNGAGKSTTMKILTGLIKADYGSVIINGLLFNEKNELEIKKLIGYVPEEIALYETLTPYEYLWMVGKLYGMDDASIDDSIEKYLDIFNMLDHVYERMYTFSHGMKQKVVITSALMHEPKILLLDEPLSGLDVNAILTFKDLLQRCAEEGKTIFYSTHILDVVEKICKRVIIIDAGKILIDGSLDEIKERYGKDEALEGIFRKLTKGEIKI